jgi:hypothetical protein
MQACSMDSPIIVILTVGISENDEYDIVMVLVVAIATIHRIN